MEIVVPERVETVPALIERADQSRLLRLVLGTQDNRAGAGAGARRPSDFREDVRARVVENLLGGVEPQAIEVKFLDPVARVRDKQLADRPRIGAVEIDCVAPFVLVPAAEISR